MRLSQTEKLIGDKWRKARKSKGLTTEDVCALLKKKGFKICISSLNKFELGKAQPKNLQVLIIFLCVIYKTEPNIIYGAD